MWGNNKFYGEKITIAFRLADGGLPASCITGGITDGAMAIPWRQNHPKKVEQRMALPRNKSPKDGSSMEKSPKEGRA